MPLLVTVQVIGTGLHFPALDTGALLIMQVLLSVVVLLFILIIASGGLISTTTAHLKRQKA